jgi:hypothetical protein
MSDFIAAFDLFACEQMVHRSKADIAHAPCHLLTESLT